MAHLNLSYEDLCAVICLSLHLANADGNVSDKECEAIIKAITDQYDFSGRDDLLREYLGDGQNMEPQDALQRIKNFGPAEKQYTSNFFAKTIVADGQLDENEKDLYWQIQDVCGLPENDLAGNSGASSAPTASSNATGYAADVCVVIRYQLYQQGIYDGRIQFWTYNGNVKNNIFDFYNNPERLYFFRTGGEITYLDNMLHNMGKLPSNRHLVMIYNPEYKITPNKAGSIVAKEPVFGEVFFAVEGPDKDLHGFPTRASISDFLRLLDALGSAQGGLLVQGENNPSLSRRYYITGLNAIPSE